MIFLLSQCQGHVSQSTDYIAQGIRSWTVPVHPPGVLPSWEGLWSASSRGTWKEIIIYMFTTSWMRELEGGEARRIVQSHAYRQRTKTRWKRIEWYRTWQTLREQTSILPGTHQVATSQWIHPRVRWLWNVLWVQMSPSAFDRGCV